MNQPARKEDNQPARKDDILTLYKMAHDWARHYQTTIAQLNALTLTFNGAIVVFIFTSFASQPSRPRIFLSVLLLPALMSFIAIFASRAINKPLRECFARMTLIEEMLGFYKLQAADGKTPLLPNHLRESATRRWPQIEVWYITNGIVMTVCMLILAYFYYFATEVPH
jgi:hypothetical protein